MTETHIKDVDIMYKEYISPVHMKMLKKKLETDYTDEAYDAIVALPPMKNPTTAFQLGLYLGIFGVDRFYAGHTLLGVLKACTLGGVLVWWVLDWKFCTRQLQEENYMKIMAAIRPYKKK